MPRQIPRRRRLQAARRPALIELKVPSAARGRRTRVDDAVKAILRMITEARLLPGDRIVEKKVGDELKISRVPVREALRILESQGVVENEPYKGIRVMSMTRERLAHMVEVRLELEVLAAKKALGPRGADRAGIAAALALHVEEMRKAARAHDAYRFATEDAEFHRAFVGAAGNPVLLHLWEGLARQLTVIFGLSTYGKPMPTIIREHERLITAVRGGSVAEVAREMKNHIQFQLGEVDFDGIIAERRAARTH